MDPNRASAEESKVEGGSVLKLAWERFALYDENAKGQQKGSNKLQVAILAIGVLGTLLALTQSTLRTASVADKLTWLDQALHYVIVIIPITLAILVSATNRFKQGDKWILLRAGAEATKREIYRFRARAGIYRNSERARTSCEAKLSSKVQSISRRLMQTEVNLSALHPYEGPIPPEMYGAEAEDDGLSFLTPDRYITIRLADQLNYYRGKTVKLDRQLKLLQWLAYIIGGVGTFLAAVGLELWIALTTALVAACTTFLEYRQVENTLRNYNQAATDLANLRGWWTTLSPEEQEDLDKVNRLVMNTESVLQRELGGWVESMEDALADLRTERAGETSGPNPD